MNNTTNTNIKRRKKVTINPNLNQIPFNKYKMAIESWEKEEKVKMKKSLIKIRKLKTYNIWLNLIIGSMIIGMETIQIGNEIMNYKGWGSLLIIGVCLMVFGLWILLIYQAFKTKAELKINEQEDILNELELENENKF